MMKTVFVWTISTLSILASNLCMAGGFAYQVKEPDFSVTIPNLQEIKMDVHPMHEEKPNLRYLGSTGPYTVSILTPTADAGMTASECASSTFETLHFRPDVPEASRVLKGRINANTFAAIYVSPLNDFIHLHAHLLSAAAGTHCIEVHVSKVTRSIEDIRPWYKMFYGANIEAD